MIINQSLIYQRNKKTQQKNVLVPEFQTCSFCSRRNCYSLIDFVSVPGIVTFYVVPGFCSVCHASQKTCISFVYRRQNRSCIYPFLSNLEFSNLCPPCSINMTQKDYGTKRLVLVPSVIALGPCLRCDTQDPPPPPRPLPTTPSSLSVLLYISHQK